MSKAFTPRAVERQRPHVRRVIDGLLDPVCEQGRCEFVADVTEPYPVMVICEVLGTPADDWKRFSVWVEILFSRLGLALDEESAALVLRTQLELDAYLTELVERRRREAADGTPGGDLLGELIAEEDGDRLATADLVTLMDNILSAGTDTTRNELASAVALFCAHPEQFELLRADPSLVEGAVEEVLRFAPVVAGTLRVAMEDLEMDGVAIPEGTMVSPTMAAANRDPAVYEDPDRFDITRTQPQPHQSFGGGPHFCLGRRWPAWSCWSPSPPSPSGCRASGPTARSAGSPRWGSAGPRCYRSPSSPGTRSRLPPRRRRAPQQQDADEDRPEGDDDAEHPGDRRDQPDEGQQEADPAEPRREEPSAAEGVDGGAGEQHGEAHRRRRS